MPLPFQIVAPYQPAADQPKAIAELAAGFEAGQNRQTLLGVNGSGKSIKRLTLVIYDSHRHN